MDKIDLSAKLRQAMAEPDFDKTLEDKLTEISTTPEGMLVHGCLVWMSCVFSYNYMWCCMLCGVLFIFYFIYTHVHSKTKFITLSHDQSNTLLLLLTHSLSHTLYLTHTLSISFR